MSKHITLSLTPEQRAELEELTRSGACLARVQAKARLLLLTDRSQGRRRPDAEVAEALGLNRSTVVRTRRRFAGGGLPAALYDRPRPGAAPKVTGDVEARLIALACSDPPEGRARWTLRLLADKAVELGYVESISHVAVGERLKKTASSPGA